MNDSELNKQDLPPLSQKDLIDLRDELDLFKAKLEKLITKKPRKKSERQIMRERAKRDVELWLAKRQERNNLKKPK